MAEKKRPFIVKYNFGYKVTASSQIEAIKAADVLLIADLEKLVKVKVLLPGVSIDVDKG